MQTKIKQLSSTGKEILHDEKMLNKISQSALAGHRAYLNVNKQKNRSQALLRNRKTQDTILDAVQQGNDTYNYWKNKKRKQRFCRWTLSVSVGLLALGIIHKLKNRYKAAQAETTV